MEPETVSVIAGGPSAGTLKAPPVGEGYVIGVNDSAIYARCDLALTMDRLWLEHRFALLMDLPVRVLARDAACKNVPRWPALEIFRCDHLKDVPTMEAGWLHGTNSGLCALNRALQLRPRRIVLIGFDMRTGPRGEPYWYPPYPWRPHGATKPGKYREWAARFGPFAAKARELGIEVEQRGHTAIPAFKEWKR